MATEEYWRSWLKQYIIQGDYLLTLQTRVPVYGYSEQDVRGIWSDWRYLINQLDRQLWGNASRRKPDTCRILAIPVLEGLKSNAIPGRTLHLHSIIGNIPFQKSAHFVHSFIKNSWKNTHYGSEMTHFEEIYDVPGVIVYITKELKKTANTIGIEYSQIPKRVILATNT